MGVSFITSGGGGPPNWSDIIIDTDKNMLGFGLSNVKEAAAGMVKGDLLVSDGVHLIRLPASVPNQVLTSNGALMLPTWQPGGLYLNRYFPSQLNLSHLQAMFIPDHVQSKVMLMPSVYTDTLVDAPGSMVKVITPAITLPLATTNAFTPDNSQSETKAVGSKFDLQVVVTGAVRDYATVLTDETAAAQNATANDMLLLNVLPVTGDHYYFGFDKVFDAISLNIGTPGVGVWGLTWQYWNGAWVNLAGVTDGTTNFMAAAGFHDVTFTRPGDWATTAVDAITKYWIRAEVAFTSIATRPLGTQCFIRITT